MALSRPKDILNRNPIELGHIAMARRWDLFHTTALYRYSLTLTTNHRRRSARVKFQYCVNRHQQSGLTLAWPANLWSVSVKHKPIASFPIQWITRIPSTKAVGLLSLADPRFPDKPCRSHKGVISYNITRSWVYVWYFWTYIP